VKKYRINDIFYSLQGEGHNTGRAAVFIRFSGCNLKCPFCDTDFMEYTEMTAEQIIDVVRRQLDSCGLHSLGSQKDFSRLLCVLTGGEPTLQVDEDIINVLHDEGFEVAMESNGTNEPPSNLDWLTVSPKEKVIVKRCNELKCIFDETMKIRDYGIEADYYYLQPCDTGNLLKNSEITNICTEYIKQHPKWQLSLQTHKLIGFK